MKVEYDALLKNGTWEIFPINKGTKIINHKWIYIMKRKPYGRMRDTSLEL